MATAIRPIIIVAALAALMTLPTWSFADDELNLYSARKEELIKPLLDRFTEQTGIKVNLVTADAAALLQRLQSEGINSPADLLLTVDAGNLHRAKEAGVTQPFESAQLAEVIPENYRDPEGHWVALSLRARPILYAKDRVDPARLSTYEALTDAEWRRKICVRSSDNIYNQSMVSAMIATLGVEQTEAWARGLVANLARPPQGGDRDQIKAAAAGQCDIAIANTYYLAGMLGSNDPTEREAAEHIAVFWPNQADRGVHINASGAALTKSATNRAAAEQLVEFLANPESQQWYAQVNGEFPVRADVPISETLAAWGPFKADAINLDQLGVYNAEAVRLMDRAGWR
ncbi:Fe(3+) ABC transporter substrate-binding protein [Thioalkalicoccus limnaeus]|uniref:Fe(3+) ABC transporter substrate-binding protein n=1 Tax=Thioalkalicoccus limnaeus TaxID=120681 RepID=UPI003F74785D